MTRFREPVTRRAIVRALALSNRYPYDEADALTSAIARAMASRPVRFCLVADLGRDTRAFRDACRRAGVAVGRPFPPLNNCVRISIGTAEEMQRAGAVFKRILGRA